MRNQLCEFRGPQLSERTQRMGWESGRCKEVAKRVAKHERIRPQRDTKKYSVGTGEAEVCAVIDKIGSIRWSTYGAATLPRSEDFRLKNRDGWHITSGGLSIGPCDPVGSKFGKVSSLIKVFLTRQRCLPGRCRHGSGGRWASRPGTHPTTWRWLKQRHYYIELIHDWLCDIHYTDFLTPMLDFF